MALDISKAFNKAWHARLLHSLWYCWLNPEYLGIFFAGTFIESCSRWTAFTSYITNVGVPQGSILGPTLFQVIINDLPDEVLSRIGIYADDITPYSSLKVESDGVLELDLHSVVEWGDRWLVTLPLWR